MIRKLIALALALAPAPVFAQTAPPVAAEPAVVADPALTARVNELVPLIAGGGDFDTYFGANFRAQFPRAKWTELTGTVTSQLGKPLAIDSIRPASPWTAYVRVKFERGILNVQIAVDPAAPHAVISLLLTNAEMAGDSFDKLATDFRALPGTGGFGVYALSDGAPKLIGGLNPDSAAPLGSAFKLWVLGELVRSINAGERRWADVVPVGQRSLPSGMTQAWPVSSPVTLQTLAILMISISDNTATDTLVTIEGTKLDAFVGKMGAPGLAPVLTTRQMFAIKSAPNADLAAQWATQPPAARRKLLDANTARLGSTPVDPSMFAGKPVKIDTLEWFASPAQTVKMFDWLRRDQTALAILSVNHGADPTTVARFDYVGFKGGSEPGVLTFNFLVRRKDGRWLAIGANWHRTDADVDTKTFITLLTRALTIAAEAKID